MTRPCRDDKPLWRLHRGPGPLVASAIHDGHALRDEVAACIALSEADRQREEDPFTAEWTEVAPTRIVGLRSRFEVDLNRPREKAVYRTPDDAWGLTVWRTPPPPALVSRSLAQYDAFYASMRTVLDEIRREQGSFVVYDLHTYNHRRAGPGGPEAEAAGNPQVNIGTGTMDRARWGPVVDAFMQSLRDHAFPGGRLDVRENVKFQGGHWSRWIHETFPDTGVSLAIEVKKFFMDEWTGQPDEALVRAIRAALAATVEPVLDRLKRL